MRNSKDKMPVDLSCWLKNVFSEGWLPSVNGMSPANSVLSARDDDPVPHNPPSDVSESKLIESDLELTGHWVVLSVKFVRVTVAETGIMAEVRPTTGQTYLPPQTQLVVMNEVGAVMMLQAGSDSKDIQVQFNGRPRERFSIKVALGEESITKNFVL